MNHLRYRSTNDLVASYRRKREAIRSRLSDFTAVKPAEYFYELIYCLLTPQSSARNAETAVGRLREANFRNNDVDPGPILSDRSAYIRFHNTKSGHLMSAKRNFETILRELMDRSTGMDLREWLVCTVKGLGWKESSHFLRNIGHRNLAILDRHILRNLKKHGVISSLPDSLSKKQYLVIENRFRRFSGQIGIDMDELDLLFWSQETGRIMK